MRKFTVRIQCIQGHKRNLITLLKYSIEKEDFIYAAELIKMIFSCEEEIIRLKLHSEFAERHIE